MTLQRAFQKGSLKLYVIKQRLKTPLILSNLVFVDDNGYLHLTDIGEKFLRSRSRRIIYNEFKRNVWGFKELEEILCERPLGVKAILKELRKRGISWKKEHQVRIRLFYLMLLGAIKREGSKYKWVGLPLSHEEIKEVLVELGNSLGYSPKEEFHIDGFRVDVVWLRSGLPGASVEYAFEIQLKGDPKSAILNLQECLRRWPAKAYIVTNPEQVRYIENAIRPWKEDIKVIDYRTLEGVAERLNDLVNMLKIRGFKFNIR